MRDIVISHVNTNKFLQPLSSVRYLPLHFQVQRFLKLIQILKTIEVYGRNIFS